MKKRFKIVFKFFISFLILFSSILSRSTVSAIDNNTEKYVGWTLKEANYDEAIYISKEGDNSIGEVAKAIVAYCFNFTYATPPYVEKDKENEQKSTVPTYTKHTATGDLFNELATSERVSGDELVKKITKILYNGYPNNAGNLKGTLSDGRFRAVTQYAVWYFTDQTMSVERPETKLTTDEKELFDKLIGEKEGAEEVPENVTLEIYKNTKEVKASTATNAAKPEYQNLLSADIVDKTTGKKIVVKPKEKISVFAKKEWANLPVTGGMTDVEFTLYKDGKKVENVENPKKILSTSTDRTVSWKNLDGELKNYTIKEENVPSDFEASTVSGEGSEANPFVITNTYKNKSGVEISVTKKWSGDNMPETNPEVYFELWKFGQPIDGTGHRKKLDGDKVTWSNIDPSELNFISVKEVNANGTPWKADNYKAGMVAKKSSTEYEVTNEYVAPKSVTKTVKFSKVNLDGEEIAGAKIQIKQGDKVVNSWTSEENKTHELELAPGEYTFHEEVSPIGYLKVTDINFKVDNDGKVTVTSKDDKDTVTTEENKLIVTDQKSGKDVEISKVNLGGEEIAGAEIQILIGGIPIQKWTSESGKTKKLVLTKGSYIFHEVVAPSGYEKVTDIKFDVDEGGKVIVTDADGNKVEAKDNKLIVTDYNESYKVKFSKKALTENGEELKGATIQVQDKDGNKVEEWVSDGTVKEFNLKPDNYKFVETKAPEGYTLATEINFSIEKDGTIKVGETKVDSNAPIVMVDDYVNHKVYFSKVNLGGEEIAGAKIQIKQGDKVVNSWTSEENKTHELELAPGEYIFHEESAPEGYLAVTDITFTVEKDGKVKIKEDKSDEAKLEGNKLVVTDKNKPEEPEKPMKPEKPVEPMKPEKPVEPTKPEKPAEPTKPEKPVEPTKPEKPAEPMKPEKTEEGGSKPEKVQTGNVYVKYVTEDGKVLEDETLVTKNGKIGDDYTTKPKDFPGYKFVRLHKTSAPKNGKVGEKDQRVIYVYKKVTTQEQPKKEEPKNTPKNNPKEEPKVENKDKKSTTEGQRILPKTSATDNSAAALILGLLGVAGLVARKRKN